MALLSSSDFDPSRIIEEGSYRVDQIPTKVDFVPRDIKCSELTEDLTRGKRMCEYRDAHFKIGDNFGNIYALRDGELQGVFYVDAGMVEDYVHPKSLPRGGKSGRLLPSFVRVESLR